MMCGATCAKPSWQTNIYTCRSQILQCKDKITYKMLQNIVLTSESQPWNAQKYFESQHDHERKADHHACQECNNDKGNINSMWYCERY